MKRALLLAGLAVGSFGGPLLVGQTDIHYVISTVAGGAPPSVDGIPATSAFLYFPLDVAVDASGNLFIADRDHFRIRKVAGNVITTVAGTGVSGYSGDGGQATAAQFVSPVSVAVDGSGNLYISDADGHRIRRVTPGGIISTAAGTGVAGFNGDNQPASAAQLNYPAGVAVDSAGNLYIADQGNHRIRKVSAAGVITTVAGSGALGSGGDGGPALAAAFYFPRDVAVDRQGNLYIADTSNHRIRRVAPTGTITNFAGVGGDSAGNGGPAGDGRPAVEAQLNFPAAVAVDRAGNVYISDTTRIRRVTPDGMIDRIAGGGPGPGIGDGGPATAALLTAQGLTLDEQGNLFVADTGFYQSGQGRVRRVSDGNITTVAGAAPPQAPEGAPATSVQLVRPEAVAVDAAGNVYFTDNGNNRVRKVSAGVMTTVAGTGEAGSGSSGDGGPARSAQVLSPRGLAVDGAGNIYIAEHLRNHIRRVTPDGIINVFAGTGSAGFDGDGLQARAALLYNPEGVAVDAAGAVYITDSGNQRVRRVSASGAIATVAGSGTQGYAGDGGAATMASLYNPWDSALDASGNLFIADTYNHVVRKVSQGTIATVAGDGRPTLRGDGGKATAASLTWPTRVAVDQAGNLYIAGWGSNRIRKVGPDGVIYTIAGAGPFGASGGDTGHNGGFSGDGGPATLARLNVPSGVAVDSAGNVYIAEVLNNRIRKLTPNPPAELAIVGGNGQSGVVGALLASPLVVRVVGRAGVGVPGITVTFAVTLGTAVLSAAAAETGPDGSAAVTVTLGGAAGSIVITASASGLAPARFTATATAGGPPAPRIGAVVGGGLSIPAVAQISPNAIATIFGENLAPPGTARLVSGDDLVGGRLPTRLGGVCVQVGPEQGRIFHVFPGQINFQVPTLAGNGEVAVQVIRNCGEAGENRSNTQMVPLQAATPQFFFFANNPDGRNPVAAVNASRPGLVGRDNPAVPGDILVLFATGFGLTEPPYQAGELPGGIGRTVERVIVSIGGIELAAEDVMYAGVTPGLAGLYQLNIRIPAAAPDGDLAVAARIGGVSTPPGAFLSVRRAP